VSFDEAIKKVALAEDTSCISDSDIPTLAKRVRPSDSVYVQSKLFSSVGIKKVYLAPLLPLHVICCVANCH
jgi:hypothetical protein